MRLRIASERLEPMDYVSPRWVALYNNNETAALVEITHGFRRFGKSDFDNLVQSMFIDACGGWEYRNLTTRVMSRSGKLFCEISIITKCEGSNIWSELYVNGDYIRRMVIAE